MEISLSLTRIFFLALSILLSLMVTSEIFKDMAQVFRLVLGAMVGISFAGFLIFADLYLKRFNLRALNILSFGLIFGGLLGYAVLFIFNAVLEISGISLDKSTYSAITTAVFLSGAYFGLVLTIRSSEQLYLSIPFMKFKPSKEKKKDILADSSILYDTRIIDLASSGLLDHHLILPRFLLKEIQDQLETADEVLKAKLRRALDVLKRLEEIPHLGIRYTDIDFHEIKDISTKMLRLARQLDAHIITADISRIQQSAIETTEGIRIINIHNLSNALKPITQAGEQIQIKIQRYGKESRQGVGYLDDGTMVVVNGGADFLGETIKAQVLSVKHTTSGRMIFCNALEEGYQNGYPPAPAAMVGTESNFAKNYFSM